MENEKKPIASVLRRMSVNDEEKWPIERMESVGQSICKFQRIHRREGVKFTTKSEEYDVVVRRLS